VSHGKPVKNQPLIHSKNVQINGVNIKLDFRYEESHPIAPIKKAKKMQNKKVLRTESHGGMPPNVLRLI
jgi:predicted amidohydrolase